MKRSAIVGALLFLGMTATPIDASRSEGGASPLQEALPFGPVTFDDGEGNAEIPESWEVVDGDEDGLTWAAVTDRNGSDLGDGRQPAAHSASSERKQCRPFPNGK